MQISRSLNFGYIDVLDISGNYFTFTIIPATIFPTEPSLLPLTFINTPKVVSVIP